MTGSPLLLAALLPAALSAQYYAENFDAPSSSPLIVEIDTTVGNLWQVGPPNKGVLAQAYSSPNVIITDTLAPYPINNTSRFTIKTSAQYLGSYPVFFARFQHSWDTDTLMEGGFVEVSWDEGATWLNVYDDWFMPVTIENYDQNWNPIAVDTLPNGQIGYSGTIGSATTGSDWIYTSICWTNIGFLPVDTFRLRFTFVSDSVVEQRDGWMVDDISVEAYFMHPVAEYVKKDDYLIALPNPITDHLQVVFDVDEANTPVHVELFDLNGRSVNVLRSGLRPKGVEYITIDRADLPEAEGMLILRARIGQRTYVERLMLAGDRITGRARR